MSKSLLSSALFLDCVENSYIHSIRWLKCNRNRIYNRFNFILENMLNLNNLWNYSFDFFFQHHWTFYRSEDCCFSAIRFSPIVKLSSLASFIQTPKIYVISISYCYLEHAGDFFFVAVALFAFSLVTSIIRREFFALIFVLHGVGKWRM